MDSRIIKLYDEYTHKPLPRREFLDRLAKLAGGAAAASALLPILENNYAAAATVDPGDPRLAAERLSYKGATGEIRAYVARPKAEGKRAGVIVVHENRGLNPHIEDVARRAALQGFTALAPDLLSPSGGTPGDDDAARDAIARLDQASTVANLVEAVAYLKTRDDASRKIGVVGFCWGGGMVNLLAEASPDLTAAVPFYGIAPPGPGVKDIKAKLMMHYAGNDERIDATIPGYEAALKAAGVTYTKYMYPGVEHGFHNDTAGPRYNKEAAELAWSRTVAFFKETLTG
ncbi:MAG: Carboxymethylenebutenolidase [Rhodospirillales bacterium]|jgi:carboxymethylenebutenolidase|nr:Carboxymethylenebutenolidase [Rhodospirillales bacterium]